MNRTRRTILTACLAVGMLGSAASTAMASAASLAAAGHRALDALSAQKTQAIWARKNAKGVLVFPSIYKGAFGVGAQTGDGVLFEHGKPTRYYNLSAVSLGLQAGGQKFSYALFFMKDSALAYLKSTDGWAIGSGPSIVIVDKGMASSSTTTTLTQDVIAFPFDARGLMAGLNLEGSKITRIHPN